MTSEPTSRKELVLLSKASPTLSAPGLPLSASQAQTMAESLPIAHYAHLLNRHKWRILLFSILCGLIAFVISSHMTPLYESTAIIDVDFTGERQAIGADMQPMALSSIEQFIRTQIRLIESDAVIRPVAEHYNLPMKSVNTWFGSPHADEEAQKMAPAALEHLRLIHPPQTFLILIQYRSEDPKRAAAVANDLARSYVDHLFRIRNASSRSLSEFIEGQLDELRSKMESSNAALQAFERELNMIDPEEKTTILSSRLIQLNTEYTAAQAERVKKEAAFRSLGQGSLDAVAISEQGENLKELQRRKQELSEAFAKVRQHYGPNHPAFAVADAELEQVNQLITAATASAQRRIAIDFNTAVQRESILAKEIAAVKDEFDGLNAGAFQYKNLKREAESDRKLYEELVAKTKQAAINANFPGSTIRIADLARPAYQPTTPNVKLNVFLGLALGLMLSVLAAVIGNALDTTVRDPEVVGATVGAEVVGVLPRVRGASGLVPAMLSEAGDPSSAVAIRGRNQQGLSYYAESIKTLHASLALMNFDQRFRSLMITSASPAEGKSTVATTIAIAHALKGKRVLLVDGDLRRPSLADKLHIMRRTGLVDICLKGMPWKDAIQSMSELPNLDVIVTGTPNRRAIDSFGALLPDLLADASEQYDLVVLDSPPLLGFPEPLQMASLVDGVLIVALTGQTNRKALSVAVSQLRRIGGNILGIVMNAATKSGQGNYYYHHSEYTHKNGRRQVHDGLDQEDKAPTSLAS